MHACGHDGHTAMGLAVAELLAEMKDSLNGTIRLIFQPGEEGVREPELWFPLVPWIMWIIFLGSI